MLQGRNVVKLLILPGIHNTRTAARGRALALLVDRCYHKKMHFGLAATREAIFITAEGFCCFNAFYHMHCKKKSYPTLNREWFVKTGFCIYVYYLSFSTIMWHARHNAHT